MGTSSSLDVKGVSMGGVAHDKHGFLVDGKRWYPIVGAIHYFRVPNELWKERLVQMRDAGLNAASLYVAWNFHEEREGEFDFSGDRDLPRFLELCAEVGLLAVL